MTSPRVRDCASQMRVHMLPCKRSLSRPPLHAPLPSSTPPCRVPSDFHPAKLFDFSTRARCLSAFRVLAALGGGAQHGSVVGLDLEAHAFLRDTETQWYARSVAEAEAEVAKRQQERAELIEAIEQLEALLHAPPADGLEASGAAVDVADIAPRTSPLAGASVPANDNGRSAGAGRDGPTAGGVLAQHPPAATPAQSVDGPNDDGFGDAGSDSDDGSEGGSDDGGLAAWEAMRVGRPMGNQEGAPRELGGLGGSRPPPTPPPSPPSAEEEDAEQRPLSAEERRQMLRAQLEGSQRALAALDEKLRVQRGTVEACRVKRAEWGARLAGAPLGDLTASVPVLPIGDSLLEPFWPQGLGSNRGFHSALDAVWAAHVLHESGLDAALLERNFCYDLMLQGPWQPHLLKPAKGWSADPLTRYADGAILRTRANYTNTQSKRLFRGAGATPARIERLQLKADRGAGGVATWH